VVRPEGFDLAEAWRLIADEVDQRRTPLVAKATAAVASVPILRVMFGTRLRIGPPVGADRVEVELRGHNVHSLAGEIAGFGAAVEVLDPPAVRERLAEVAAELGSLYVSAEA
jgi:predicted DNA-binding transcriptional regulator YafY